MKRRRTCIAIVLLALCTVSVAAPWRRHIYVLSQTGRIPPLTSNASSRRTGGGFPGDGMYATMFVTTSTRVTQYRSQKAAWSDEWKPLEGDSIQGSLIGSILLESGFVSAIDESWEYDVRFDNEYTKLRDRLFNCTCIFVNQSEGKIIYVEWDS